MDLAIKIQIDLSDRAHSVLQELSAALRCSGGDKPAPGARPTTQAPQAMNAPVPAVEPAQVPETAPATVAPAQSTAPDTPAAPSFGDRAKTIMATTRDRLEGADWENRDKGGRVDAIHRALTAKFKAFAAEAGFNKPSEIDSDAGLNAFAAACAALSVDADGNVKQSECPF